MARERLRMPRGRRRLGQALVTSEFHKLVVSKIRARQRAKEEEKLSKRWPCPRCHSRVHNDCGDRRGGGGGFFGGYMPFLGPSYDSRLNLGFSGVSMPSYYGYRSRGSEERISPIGGKEEIARKLTVKAQRAKTACRKKKPRHHRRAPLVNKAYRKGNGRSQLSGRTNRALKKN